MVISKPALIALLTLAGFPAKDHAALTCIVEWESSFRSDAYNPKSNDYGLFQINYRWWNEPCGIKDPQELFNLATNIKCAKIVYDKQGLTAWVAYKKKCIKKPAQAPESSAIIRTEQ